MKKAKKAQTEVQDQTEVFVAEGKKKTYSEALTASLTKAINISEVMDAPPTEVKSPTKINSPTPEPKKVPVKVVKPPPKKKPVNKRPEWVDIAEPQSDLVEEPNNEEEFKVEIRMPARKMARSPPQRKSPPPEVERQSVNRSPPNRISSPDVQNRPHTPDISNFASKSEERKQSPKVARPRTPPPPVTITVQQPTLKNEELSRAISPEPEPTGEVSESALAKLKTDEQEIKDRLSVRIENLRQLCEEKFGEDDFMKAYRLLRQVSHDDEDMDMHEKLQNALGDRFGKLYPHVKQIQHLIYCEDKFYG
ncbi:developmentally-regulated protein [Acrasis kona]|uniref:Developmentally-regulated protein n=1 Tax=Acrasis kona TaxID=1008807 RepID=A0AAW2YVU8_9EUKA